MPRYLLYVIDDRGQSVGVDSHDARGPKGRIRTRYVSTDKPFTIVLESEEVYTYFVVDENGDIIIEQADKPRPRPKRPRRKSRFNWQKSSQGWRKSR